jgi:hypothetical protein
MHGLTDPRWTPRAGHIVVAALVAVALTACLTLGAPARASASGCTDSWTNTAGGDWFTGSDWSGGAPPGPSDEACIAAAGTYTVAMIQLGTPVSVRSLTVGGGVGTQTLMVGVCSGEDVGTLTTTAGLSVGAHGAVVLDGVPPGSGEACGAPGGLTLAGPISNAGALTVEPVSNDAARQLQGDLTNTGTLAIQANTAYNGAAAAFENEGALEVAGAAVLTVPTGNSLTNGTGGSIAASGSGGVVVKGKVLLPAMFTEGMGSISGARPVVVDNGTLTYAGTREAHGSGPITLSGDSTLLGNVRHGQTLTLESACADNSTTIKEHGEPKGAGGNQTFLNGGTIELFDDNSCNRNLNFSVGSSRFYNYGTLLVDNPHNSGFFIEGCGTIVNEGIVQLDAPLPRTDVEFGSDLTVLGRCRYEQTPSGRVKTFIAGTAEWGRMTVDAGGLVEGTLAVRAIPPFVAAVGRHYPIFTSNQTEGRFDIVPYGVVEEPVHYTGYYYMPSTSPNFDMELVAMQATEKLSPAGGAPGSLVKVSGRGYAGGNFRLQQIELTFTDHEGVKTTYPLLGIVETPQIKIGEFQTEVEIPASAAPGAGKITVTSPQMPVRISREFNVS